ncbi:MAG: hypothetical protein HY023_04785 [Chloroflexi bacterium]|nr:hypothetical protein [Chloroflexota bacterium]
MARTRTNAQRSIDPAAQQMLIRAEELGLATAFTRAEAMAACPIGIGNSAGICCKNCFMGPCRLTKEGQVGVCGATVETIAARNLARAVAAGSAAHSDHGRDVAFTLLATAEGEAQGYKIRDETKLRAVARKFGVPTEKRKTEEIAKDIALKAIAQFGQQTGELIYDLYQDRAEETAGTVAKIRRRPARR